MQINLKNLQIQNLILFSLIGIGLVLVGGNFFGKEVAYTISNVLYTPIPLSMVVLSGIIVRRFGITGQHGKAWILFLGFALSWFVAEQLWLLYDLVYDIDPFPAEADFFYLFGYVLLFLFTLYYLKPVKKAISKKMLASACLLSVALLVPTIYIVFTYNQAVDWFDLIVAASYPVADAIVICPAILGVALFFKGRVSFLWSVMCLAIVLSVVANTTFLFLSMDNSYYVGHPIDMLYLWSYVLFSFGAYSHIKIFKNYNKTYENPEELR